jgi:hypothetical protein
VVRSAEKGGQGVRQQTDSSPLTPHSSTSPVQVLSPLPRRRQPQLQLLLLLVLVLLLVVLLLLLLLVLLLLQLLLVLLVLLVDHAMGSVLADAPGPTRWARNVLDVAASSEIGWRAAAHS